MKHYKVYLEETQYYYLTSTLEYIHNNPCMERWQLCEFSEQYPFSSARDYLLNKTGILNIEKV